jgi:hypothetical protein
MAKAKETHLSELNKLNPRLSDKAIKRAYDRSCHDEYGFGAVGYERTSLSTIVVEHRGDFTREMVTVHLNKLSERLEEEEASL